MPGPKPTAPDLSLKQPVLIAVDVPQSALPPPAEGRLDLLEIAEAGIRVRLPGGATAALAIPPMIVSGVVTGDPMSTKVKRLLEWLGSFGMEVPRVVEWRRGTEAEALQLITRTLGKSVAHANSRRQHAVEEVLRLRKANTELQYRFAFAEEALLRSAAAPAELGFVNEPASETGQHVLLGETEAGISQLLPVGSAGVAGIAVHFGPAGEGSAGTLLAQLRSLEDGRTLERWVIPSDAIHEGWNLLGLTRAISGLSRSLELVLSRKSPDERLPPLSLGTGQALTAYQIRDVATGQPALRNSLALQVWAGLPGVRTPAQPHVHLPQRRAARSGGFAELPLPAALLTAAEHANPEKVQFDFPAVVGPPGERAVMCHAPVHGLTLGQLGGTVPENAIRIGAAAFIDNQQSKDVDFALIVAGTAERATGIAEGRVEIAPAEAFSGWQPVKSGQLRHISALREASGAGARLFVATRMTVPGDNSYARARFKDFSVMVQA